MPRVRPFTYFLLAAGAMTFAAASDTPKAVWIARDGAQVMSGPGEAFYPVSMLPAGTQLEVYETTSDGWLAIRPPEGSFSLVSAVDVDPINSQLGRINRNGTRSRVGSANGTRHDAVHVTFAEGDTVQLLGKDPADPKWLRIAPPAGEFRYVHERDVSDASVATDSAWRSRDGIATQQVATASGEVAVADQFRQLPAVQTSPPVPAAQQVANTPAAYPATTSVTAPTATPPVATPPVATPPVATPPSATPSAAITTTPAADAAPGETPPAPEALTVEQSIDALEFAIARRVSEPINVWKLDDLEQQTATLLASTSAPAQQATLRQIAERLDRFAKLHLRYQATRDSSGLVAQTPPQAPPVTPSTASAAPRPVDDGITPLEPATGQAAEPRSAFDAIGVLKPVVSKRAGAPPYALVDDEGRIVTFITPSPSLNVQPLLGHKVGVSGTRGFMPEYQQRHVATARIEAMPMPMRR